MQPLKEVSPKASYLFYLYLKKRFSDLEVAQILEGKEV